MAALARQRTAARAATEATTAHLATTSTVCRRWGSLPQCEVGIPAWAEAVARQRADTDPRVTDASRNAEQTQHELGHIAERHTDERAALRRRILGNLTPSTAEARAVQWRGHADQARHDLAEIEALPVTEAAQLIREWVARAQTEEAVAEPAQTVRDARAAKLGQFHAQSIDQGRTGPERDGIGM
ncbi:hypothetical protein E3T55_17290 [Cryobacterium frigoriphilum]|uniref:Uncharacterized protein n=1 Tax=Cryobacterium frigoriphilum TaxID=1259150 RepID=A0A4R8ZUQ4_9MICO|nr:hypothetical protein [Cryobacterium frigoriphilum]TFD46365.1 hypothetical protein E3T55_17290 [Cryobacterium frigoriphilum]